MKKKSILLNNVFMLKLIAQYCPSQIILSIFSALFASVVSVFNIILLKYVIDSIINPISYIETVCLILINATLALLQSVVNNYLNTIVTPRNTLIIQQKIQNDMFQKAVEVDLKCYEDPVFYNRFTMALRQAESRALAVLQTFTSILSSLFGISTLTALIVKFNPDILLISAICVVVSFVFNYNHINIRHKYVEETIPSNREVSYVKRVVYLENHAKDLRFFPIAKALQDMFAGAISKMTSLINKYGPKMVWLESGRAGSSIVGNAIILCCLAKQVFSGYASVGDFSAMVSSTQQLSTQMTALLSTFPQMYEHGLYIANYRDFIEYQPSILLNEDGKNVPSNPEISFRNVSFRYDEQGPDVLKKINIQIKAGEHVALVGRNGSGKSSLVKLITRLYDPNEGAIFLNGLPYQDYSLKSLRQSIGVMFQDYYYYALTIAENVLMRHMSVEHRFEDEKLVERALQVSGLYEKVLTLPDGIYTRLTREFDENGAFLSGGELQKLALARIYARDCDLIILDEPSSALDPVAEKELFDAMKEVGKDKTVIMISHRLANVISADRILLLAHGEIVEEGTHDELMILNGHYAEMFRMQAEQYKINV